MKFESEYNFFHSWKYVWSCRLGNGGHFELSSPEYGTPNVTLMKIFVSEKRFLISEIPIFWYQQRFFYKKIDSFTRKYMNFWIVKNHDHFLIQIFFSEIRKSFLAQTLYRVCSVRVLVSQKEKKIWYQKLIEMIFKQDFNAIFFYIRKWFSMKRKWFSDIRKSALKSYLSFHMEIKKGAWGDTKWSEARWFLC